jgi:hypothetical protein
MYKQDQRVKLMHILAVACYMIPPGRTKLISSKQLVFQESKTYFIVKRLK